MKNNLNLSLVNFIQTLIRTKSKKDKYHFIHAPLQFHIELLSDYLYFFSKLDSSSKVSNDWNELKCYFLTKFSFQKNVMRYNNHEKSLKSLTRNYKSQ